ncbi:universal stress protein [Leifsonia xyli]|uniref:universal stress protein n=1 Tax=Leifsonia xyli TaxID=1575 RepID=UPI003D67C171
MTYTILVAVDGEAGHRAALDWAAARAARDGARLRLVHVVERAWGDAHDKPGSLLELAAGTLLDEEKQVAVQRIREAAARRVPVGSTAGEPSLRRGRSPRACSTATSLGSSPPRRRMWTCW